MRSSRRLICLFLVALFLVLPFASVYADDMDVMDPATFGLNPDKPYDGTHLDFLICCSTAPQFASATVKGDEEFTAMTGISVTWAMCHLAPSRNSFTWKPPTRILNSMSSLSSMLGAPISMTSCIR